MKVPHAKNLRSSSYFAASDRSACWSSNFLPFCSSWDCVKAPILWFKTLPATMSVDDTSHLTIWAGKNNCKNHIPRLWARLGRPLPHLGCFHGENCILSRTFASSRLQHLPSSCGWQPSPHWSIRFLQKSPACNRRARRGTHHHTTWCCDPKTHQNIYKNGYKNIVPVSLSASKRVSFVGPERKTKIGNQRHKKETAAFGVQHIIKIHYSDSGIETEICNDFPLHPGFLCLKMWTVWGKANETSFWRRTCPWTNYGNTSKSSGKTQKSRRQTLQSCGLGGQIPNSRNFLCAPHFYQKSPKVLKQNVQDSCFQHLPTFFLAKPWNLEIGWNRYLSSCWFMLPF